MAEDVNREIERVEENSEEKKTPARLSWADALAVAIIFCVAQVIGGVLGATLGEAVGFRLPGEAMTTSFDSEVLEAAASMQARFVAVAYLCSMVVCYAMLLVLGRMRRWPMKGLMSLRGMLSPSRLLVGYLLMWCVNVAIEPLSSMLPGDQSALGGGGWLLFSAVLLAPVFEESVFRGYIGGLLRRRYGGLVAWIASAVVFGVIHFIPSVVLTATLSGLVLGYFYLRYRSLGLAIMLHAMNNATACFLRTVDMGDMTTREMLGGGTLYWVVYGVCAVVAVTALVRMGYVMYGIKSDNNPLKE